MNETATTEPRTEASMREEKVPFFNTSEQLQKYIDELVGMRHDYGTCAYAMSLAATAAFNFVAHQLGTTGFQAGCADLDFLRRSRSIDGPFIFLKAEDAIYPQYDIRGKVNEWLGSDDMVKWLGTKAAQKLAACENDSMPAHPAVKAHWRALVQASQAVKP